MTIRRVDKACNLVPSPPATPVDGPLPVPTSELAQLPPNLALDGDLGLPPRGAPQHPSLRTKVGADPRQCEIQPQCDHSIAPCYPRATARTRWPRRRGSTAAIPHRDTVGEHMPLACIAAALATQYKRVVERNAAQRKRAEDAEELQRKAAQVRRRAEREAAAAEQAALMREEQRLHIAQFKRRASATQSVAGTV